MTAGAVLLLILKILGIIIGSIIGLVLLLLLAVLFVPVRYRAKVNVNLPDYRLKAYGSWLLHIIHASFTLEDGTALCLRVFGIPVKKIVTQPDPEKEKDDRSLIEKILDKILPRREEAEFGNEETDSDSDFTAGDETAQNEPENEPDVVLDDAVSGETVTESAPEPAAKDECEKTSKDILEEILSEEDEHIDPSPAPATAPSAVKKKRGIFNRIKGFFSGIAQKIKGAAAKAAEAYNKAHDKYEQVSDFLDDDDNMEALRLIRDRLLILLRHIRPRVIKGKLILGLEDPATTGKIIGAYYAFFAPGKDFLDLRGEFYEEIVQGRVYIRGHIRIIHLLIAFIKLYKNKKIKSWIKKED